MDQATSDERTRTIATLYGNHQAAAELTVRDFYAAHVLAALAPNWPTGAKAAAELTRAAFQIADAAIQERAR